MTAPRRLARFAWGVLAYNVLVVAWGAFVRATSSGAGCGRHWPLCNGQIVPHTGRIETFIEMTHRASSFIALLLVVALLVWTRRVMPVGHFTRKTAAFAMAFMLGEAILGAGLVLLELVAGDKSIARGVSIILHLGNTFLLMAALAMTAWWLTVPSTKPTLSTKPPRVAMGFLVLSLASVLLVASTGAIAALGDTLFPSHSLTESLAQDLGPMSHVFLRLRLLHPFFACASGVLVIATSRLLRAVRPESARVRSLSLGLTTLFCMQMAAGLLNVTLLAPVWMQLVHLTLADFTWLALVLSGVEMRWGLELTAVPSAQVTPSFGASAPVA